MKYILFAVVILVIAFGGGFYYFQKNFSSIAPSAAGKKSPTEIRVSPRAPMTPEQAAFVRQNSLAPEVEQSLSDIASTLRQLVEDPAILAGVRAANEKSKTISVDDITRLDEQWIATKSPDAFITSVLNNSTSQSLMAFQRNNPGFKELFIADARGLNVGETDKTSDFYQADEAWWVNAMNGGIGKTFHGNIEFDQSSQTEAIAMYVPVIDPSSKQAIGVLKAVLDISALGKSL